MVQRPGREHAFIDAVRPDVVNDGAKGASSDGAECGTNDGAEVGISDGPKAPPAITALVAPQAPLWGVTDSPSVFWPD